MTPPPDEVDLAEIDPLSQAARRVSKCGWCSDDVRVVWCVTKNARSIPIEYGPNPSGNVEISINGDGPPFATVHASPPGMVDPGWVAYMPHHATCRRDRKNGASR